jgi:hypothetical protein
MPIEKSDNGLAAPEQSAGDAIAKNILIDGGIDKQKADFVIRTCHEKFHDEIKPQMMEEMARRVLQELHETPFSGTLQEVLNTTNAIVEEEMRKLTEAGEEKEEKTIYRGIGGVELKENSNN